jgi:cytosine/adenosine deaminase-related metal-dependent hydrolase
MAIMVQQSIILRNGTALIHDADNHVVPTKTDILIEDGKIAKIAENIELPANADIIDCTDKIISPGFIDTHHHGWQTQLKGRHANELFLEYMMTGKELYTIGPDLTLNDIGGYGGAFYTAQDAFWGQLAGMLEALAAGTTTIVDHAHNIFSPQHAKLGIAATASSGIRAVYCYDPSVRPKSFAPLEMYENPLEEWIMQTFAALADQAPFGDGRVTLGFAYDLWFLPAEVTRGVLDVVEAKNIRTITAHGNPWTRVTQNLSDSGLLDERYLISHGGIFTKEDAETIKRTGAHVSATPSTELQMSLGGRPICFDASFTEGEDRAGIQENASFGVDCHSNQSGSIISEARIGLQDARMHFHENLLGKTARKLPESLSVEATFNLATIKGAEAVRMEKDIGRIAEGYKADLVVFDGLTPAMVCAAQYDPVAAIILHSSPADIDLVMADGVVRKKDGAILPVDVDALAKEAVPAASLTWKEIARETMKSREAIVKQADEVNVAEGVAALEKIWHLDESTFRD